MGKKLRTNEQYHIQKPHINDEGFNGGAYRIRTDRLLRARQAL